MRTGNTIFNKIYTLSELQKRLAQWRITGKTVSFTNGCFDILHEGHIASLSEAANYADYLVVGLNDDASVKRLKGATRPVNNENSRAVLLASLTMVDAVVLFSEDTPLNLIKSIKPEFLVKGGDYKIEDIVGAKEVIESGGQVIINPIKEGFSTTGLIRKLQDK